MSWKMRFFILSLLLWFFLASSPTRLSAQPGRIIEGSVEDALTGKPIPNATFIVWDLDFLTKQTTRTNASGMYSVTVTTGHTYRLYAYFDDPRTPGFDYVPVRSVDFTPKQPVTELSCKLLPGASVFLHDRIYCVWSKIYPSRFSVDVVDPYTGAPPIPDPEDANFTNIFTWGGISEDVWYLKFGDDMAVIPANTPVDLKTGTYGLTKDWPSHIREFQFPVDNNANHYSLSQGELVSADLSWYSLAASVGTANQEWDQTWGKLVEMERAGFYMGDVKEVVSKARGQMDSAETLRTQGEYEKSFDLLSEAYWIVRVRVILRLKEMWLVAKSSAVVMPLFPAFFAVTMGFFLFEKIRRKIAASCIFYVASTAILYYVYPGFQIVEARLLLALTSSIFALVLFAVFGLPRLIKEPDIPGPYPFRAVLSVVFSMGKRNVKRRLSRGVLTIASLTVLVLAFTTFTSFGRALGLLTGIEGVPTYEGILIQNLPPPWIESELPYLPIPTDEVDWLKDQNDTVTLVSPLVWSQPQAQPLGVLSRAEKELVVFGILGIDPSSEANLTNIDQMATPTGSLSELENVSDGAIISQEAANHLGAHKGDILSFYISTAGGTQFYRNLTVVGIIDDEELSKVIDLNGEPLLPFKKVTEEGKSVYKRTDTSEVLVLSWENALDIPGHITAISRIAFRMRSPENSDSFARKVIWGKEYNVWVSLNGKVTWYRFGTSLEVGGFTLLVPLIIVLLNVGLVMISIVSERTQEIFTLTCVGFNPTHIAALFLAESIVIGLVGGGLGYLLGLSSYRLMTLLSIDISVKQKLEWYWSAIGVLLSVIVAVLSAWRPASRAVMSATPSLVKKIKLPEEERVEREEEVWKVYQAQTIAMPVKVHEREELFFSSYFSTRMQEMETGLFERVEDCSETEEETPTGDRIKRFTFTYIYILETGPELATVNELVARKKSGEDRYTLRLICRPKTPGLLGTWLDRTTRFVRDILGDWEEKKSSIMGVT